MAGISDEIKNSFQHGTAVVKLIYINLGVFIIVKLLYVLFFLFSPTLGDIQGKSFYFQQNVLTYLMLPASFIKLLYRPWTLISYMFLHFDFIHILSNLLWLFWFGRIFLHYLTEKQLYTTYLLGGLAGALLFIVSYNIFPGLVEQAPFAQALGASASVTAIVISISFYTPNYTVYIPFIGPVKIKYIAIFFLVLDLLQIASSNAGGHIAHLGGAIYGYFFAMQLKRGKDLGKGFSKIGDSIAVFLRQRPKMKVSYKKQAKYMNDQEYNRSKAEYQKEIDRILDKIAKSGYESLTKSEKETLFKMSNQS
jgi:membrane associated rhomboid family serine protease